MIGSQKQISWALSIRDKVLSTIANNSDEFPLCEEMIDYYKEIEDAGWWIGARQDFASKDYILVFGLVSLVQNVGFPEACDEVVRLQNDATLGPIFDDFKENWK